MRPWSPCSVCFNQFLSCSRESSKTCCLVLKFASCFLLRIILNQLLNSISCLRVYLLWLELDILSHFQGARVTTISDSQSCNSFNKWFSTSKCEIISVFDMEVEEQVREFLVLEGSQMLFKLSKQAQLCLLRREMLGEEEFPEAKVNFQEIFLGHASPISRCRFSASGNNIASASVDGTVRIWTYDSSIPTSRNATIYCGAEIMSLDWECKSGRLLLIGTADGGIKGWNVDAKRVVCDLNTSEVFRSVLDLKCSPVEPVFVSAAASRRQGSNYLDSLGFASLTVWNMKTWRVMTALPLGEDPPAITSLCFNHNGKILTVAATDGMMLMFGVTPYPSVRHSMIP
ncbi:hypothetical protein P3X46_023848 [Hevea brasiliensis]|uniref:Anaphase-promoting complex subunit 4 WD40 domain-containing protein n=1 Tax=Hevea brasiliensis TaxID=3981 RepID=A0ABQ9LC91_HEVBR|nr:hypothetical protein P3X46_023848 [Hevea brasiliensis]